MDNLKLEKLGLQLSVGGTLFMSILGLSFGIWIQSEAILLDGFFNVISLIMAIAALWVSWLIRRPDSPRFQFGYLNFIPLVNVIKGLLIFVVSLFALISSVIAIIEGGRSINAGMAVIYAIIAASGCLIIAITQHIIGKKTGSTMVIVDSQNWLVNGLISMSVGVAFGIVVFIKGTSLDWFVTYSDSTIVIMLVLASIYVPIKIIWESAHQLLLGAPNSHIQRQIKNVFENAIVDFPCLQYILRMTQTGQYIYLHVYWLLPRNHKMTTIEELDQIRLKLTELLQQTYSNITVDVILTQEPKWLK